MKNWCLLMAALSFAPLSSAQQVSSAGMVSLHQQQVGTIVEGFFVLAGRIVPLPDGHFTLIHARKYYPPLNMAGTRGFETSEMAEITLAQIAGSDLRIFVFARTNLEQKSTWTDEPCKRTDTLFRLDRAKSFNRFADCLLVNHVVGYFRDPKGVWSEIYDGLKARGVSFPLPTALEATITRINEKEYLRVTYAFNPTLFGYTSEDAVNWDTSSWHKSKIGKDPAKVAFVSALSDWGVSLMPLVDEGFKGNNVFNSALRAPVLRLPVGTGR